MEQRLHPRSSANHVAWIQFGEIPPLAVTAGNISADGLLLKLTHPALTPAVLMNVTMVGSENHCTWISRAMVVHTSRSGTGVLLLSAVPSGISEPECVNAV